MADESLDLTSPGQLWANADNYKSVTFHLVDPAAGYDKPRLTANPAVNPNDDLMKPLTVNYTDVGPDKDCVCDLATGNRAAEIMQKLTERYDRGQPKLEKIRALYIVQAREGNRIPEKLVGEIKDLKLEAIPTLTLKWVINYLTVQNWKNGQKEFHAQLFATGGVEEVELTIKPEVDMKVADGGPSGKGKITMKVQEGKKYTIVCQAPFRQREESKQELMERQYISYNKPMPWNAWGEQSRGWVAQRSGQSSERFLPGKFTREVWDGAILTLRAAGTGKFNGLIRTVPLTAQEWAAAWLLKEPPPPFQHNVC